MSHTYRLEVGTRWLNQWTKRRCEVVATERYAVTVKMLDAPFEEKHFPDQAGFLEAYVADQGDDAEREG